MNLYQLSIERITSGVGFQPTLCKTQARSLCHTRSILPLLFLSVFVTNLKANDALIAKQFVNATTIVVAKIDSKRIGLPEALSKKLASAKELQHGTKSVGNALQEIIVALNGESVYVVVDVPFSAAQSPVRLFVKNAPGLDEIGRAHV